MKGLFDILCWVVGLIAAAVAVWQFMAFATFRDARGMQDMWAGTSHLWLAIGAAIVAIAAVVVAYARRPHVEEEIHITK